jgi:hypothetical protein
MHRGKMNIWKIRDRYFTLWNRYSSEGNTEKRRHCFSQIVRLDELYGGVEIILRNSLKVKP